jgi:hypothetical protein
MQSKGWVKLWREQFTHEVSDRKPWCDGYAWSYLYSQANYKPGIANFRNQYIPVERGQFVTSVLKLHEIFGWSRQRTIAYIISLATRQMLTYRTTNRFIVITICNYEKYQGTDDENETTDGTTDGTTDEQQTYTIKEVKEVKNKKARSFKTKRAVALADDEFIEALKQNLAYKGIDIDREIGKLDAWLLTPRGRGKMRTQQRLVGWLNRAEKPMEVKDGKSW